MSTTQELNEDRNIPLHGHELPGATGMGALLAQQLVGVGEHVVDVPPKLSSRVRLMDTGRIDKSDPNDSRSAAGCVAQRER